MTAKPPMLISCAPWAAQRAPRAAARLIAAAVFVPAVAILLIAWTLTPESQGLGTHQQLGLPPCGFRIATGLPCATCGMTTAFTYAAHGHLLSSLITQPAGAALALITAMAALLSGWALLTGASLAPLGRMIARPSVVLVVGVLLLLAWIYTIAIHYAGI
jgi:hypothetical protein